MDYKEIWNRVWETTDKKTFRIAKRQGDVEIERVEDIDALQV
jgi:hypothetical protein